MSKRLQFEVEESEPNTKPRKYSGESRFTGSLTFVFLMLVLFGGAAVAEYYFGVPILQSIDGLFEDTFSPGG